MAEFGYIPAANPRRWQNLGLGIIEWEKEIDQHDNPVTHIMMPDGFRYRIVRHKAKPNVIYGTLYAGNNKFMRYKHFLNGTLYICLGKYRIMYQEGSYDIAIDPNGPESLRGIFASIADVNQDVDSLFVLNILLHAGNNDIWHSKTKDNKVVDSAGNEVRI